MDQQRYSPPAENPTTYAPEAPPSPAPTPRPEAYPQRSGSQDFWRPIEAELGLPPGFLEIDEHLRGQMSGPARRTEAPSSPSEQYRPGMYADRWPAPGAVTEAQTYRERWRVEHQGQQPGGDARTYREQWWQGRQTSPSQNPTDYRQSWWHDHKGRYNDGRYDTQTRYVRPDQQQQYDQRYYQTEQQWNTQPGCYETQCDPRSSNVYREQWWQNRQTTQQWDQRNQYNNRTQWQPRTGYDYQNPNAYRQQWWQERQGVYNQPGDPRNPNNYRNQWQWEHRDPRYQQPQFDPRQDPNYYRQQWRMQHQDQRFQQPQCNPRYDQQCNPRYQQPQVDPRYDQRYDQRLDQQQQYREQFENQNWQRLQPVLRQLQGYSVSQFDRNVPDDLGCARAVSLAIENAYGVPIRESSVEGLCGTIQRYGWVRISPDQMQPGDLVLGFRGQGQKGHAAIYIGNDQIFNNDSNARRMQVDSLGKFRSREFVEVKVFRKAR